MQTSTSFRQRY